MTAILELSEHSNSICILNFTLYMHKYISYLKNSIFLTVSCHFTAQWHYMIGDGGHLGYWQPYWNNLNIWTVSITLVEHFLCLKHNIYYHHYLSQPFAALLRQKIWFQDCPWRPYWKMAAILKFWLACVFFSWRVTPIEYLCQICCLYHNLNDSSDICNYLLHYCGSWEQRKQSLYIDISRFWFKRETRTAAFCNEWVCRSLSHGTRLLLLMTGSRW